MANWCQDGVNFLLSELCKGTTAGGGTIAADALYIGLATAAPTATSTLATITEHSTAGGYARKNLTSASCTVSAGSLSATAVTWGTGITLTNATHWFLCTSASGTTGKIFCWGALSATRSLTTADTLTETLTGASIS